MTLVAKNGMVCVVLRVSGNGLVIGTRPKKNTKTTEELCFKEFNSAGLAAWLGQEPDLSDFETSWSGPVESLRQYRSVKSRYRDPNGTYPTWLMNARCAAVDGIRSVVWYRREESETACFRPGLVVQTASEASLSSSSPDPGAKTGAEASGVYFVCAKNGLLISIVVDQWVRSPVYSHRQVGSVSQLEDFAVNAAVNIAILLNYKSVIKAAGAGSSLWTGGIQYPRIACCQTLFTLANKSRSSLNSNPTTDDPDGVHFDKLEGDGPSSLRTLTKDSRTIQVTEAALGLRVLGFKVRTQKTAWVGLSREGQGERLRLALGVSAKIQGPWLTEQGETWIVATALSSKDPFGPQLSSTQLWSLRLQQSSKDATAIFNKEMARVGERAYAVARSGGDPLTSFAPGNLAFDNAELIISAELSDKSPHVRKLSEEDILFDEFQATVRKGDLKEESSLFPAIRRHGGEMLQGGPLKVLDKDIEDIDSMFRPTEPVFAGAEPGFPPLRVFLSVNNWPGRTQSVRFGALDLEMPPFEEVDQDKTERVMVCGILLTQSRSSDARVQIVQRWRLKDVRPAVPEGPDEDRDINRNAAYLGEDIDRPLLIRLGTRKAAPGMMLEVSEEFGDRIGPTLRATLKASERGGDPERLLVLGRRPFHVAAMTLPTLASRADASNTEVAVWSSGAFTGSSWRLRDPSETTRIVLPTQIIGEAMEKRADDAGSPDISVGEAANFRFGPQTLIDIDPSPLDAGFVEPSWNIERIFGRPGDGEPGARLRRVHFELLYGMTGTIDGESPENPPVRISDLSARYGILAGPLSEIRSEKGAEKTLNRHIRDWNSLRAATQSRPLALSLTWANSKDRFEMRGEGVAFRLRSSAFLKYPIDDADVPDKGPWKQKIKQDVDGTTTELWSEDGHLPGGAAWGFESKAVLESVYREPRSNDGQVSDLMLTPLGGSGTVRGIFDNRRQTIEAVTAIGRTHRYALERIGRINRTWNRAKHVIVYERTVVPPAQFYNEEPIGKQQDPHTGRAICRKVQEYVELIEDTRSYPDTGGGQACGFVKAAVFRSKRINIDSRWGRDVDGGWCVPLWQASFGSAPALTEDSPSSLYPKPHISLICARHGSDTQEVEIDTPERLFFFTSSREEDGDNTDAWPVTPSLDFCDEVWADTGLPINRLADVTRAGALSDPSHYIGMTLRLTRGGPVAIAAGYADQGPVAVLESILFARSRPIPVDATSLAGGMQDLGKLRSALGDVEAMLRNTIAEVMGNVVPGAAVSAEVKQRLAEVAAGYTGLNDQIQSLYRPKSGTTKKTPIQNVLEEAGKLDPCVEVARLLSVAVDSRVAGVKRVFKDAFLDLRLRLQEPVNALVGLQAAEQGKVDQFFRNAEIELEAFHTLFSGVLDRIEISGFGLGAQAEEVVKRACDGVAGLFGPMGPVREAVGGINAEVAALRRLVEDLADETASIEGRELEDWLGSSGRVFIAFARAEGVIQNVQSRIASLPPPIQDGAAEVCSEGLRRVGRARANADDLKVRIEDALLAADRAQQLKSVAKDIECDLIKELQSVEEVLRTQAGDLLKAGAEGKYPLADADTKFKTAMKVFYAMWPATVAQLRCELNEVFSYIASRLEDLHLRAKSTTEQEQITRIAIELQRCAFRAIDKAEAAIEDEIDKANEGLRPSARPVPPAPIKDIDLFVDYICEMLKEGLDDLARQAESVVYDLNTRFGELVGSLEIKAEAGAVELQGKIDELIDELNNHNGSFRQAIRGLDKTRAELGRTVTAFQLAKERAEKKVEAIHQRADTALTLIQAIGDPPKQDLISADRPSVAYVFNRLDQAGVGVTSFVAQVNRASATMSAAGKANTAIAELLTEFGIRLPTSAVGDQLIPDSLKNFDISRLFPQFGGLDLSSLFDGEKFPAIDGTDVIKITHGFNEAEMRGWLSARVDTPLGSQRPRKVVKLGPVELQLGKGNFKAVADFTVGVDGSATRKVTGAIKGDWMLFAGGTRLVTFVQTTLSFDETGQFGFDAAADRIQLADAVSFLSGLMTKFGGEASTRLQPIQKDGRIIGFTAPYQIKSPELNFGAFAISKIDLLAEFEIRIDPEFSFGARVDANSKSNPFTLTVGSMMGAGYMTSSTSVVPGRRLVTQRVAIAIAAGIGRDLNLSGVAKGHGSVLFGAEVEIQFTTAGGGGGAITAFMLVRGQVLLLGIADCSIALRLSITYDTAGGARSTGTLSVRIKISFFYTLSVDRSVTHEISGGGGSYSGNFA